MRVTKIFYLLILISLIFSIGCSKGASDPTSADIENGQEFLAQQNIPINDAGRFLLGVYDLTYNPGSSNLEITPSRTLAGHLNVTSYLFPPKCADCIKYKIIAYHRNSKTLSVDITLKNPTTLIAYDVRGIVYTTNAVLEPLRNADNWTSLYDIPGGNTMNINPFKAFCTDIAKRKLAGLASSTVNFQFNFVTPTSIQFAFDASFPGNCGEPYQIKYFKMLSPMANSVEAESDVEVEIKDWQNDITGVIMWAPDLDSGSYFTFHKETHYWNENIWGTTLFNNEGVNPGIYKGLIRATSSSSYLYYYVTYQVGNSATSTGMVEFCEVNAGLYEANSAAVDKGSIYTFGSDNDGINHMVKIDKPTCEIQKDQLNKMEYVGGDGPCAVSDDYLYTMSTMHHDSEYSFFCVVDKETMSVISTLELPNRYIMDIALDGDLVWCSGADNTSPPADGALISINVKDPYNPVVETVAENLIFGNSIAVQNEYVYVTDCDFAGGKLLLKIYDKEYKNWKGSYSEDYQHDGLVFNDVVVTGNMAYVAMVSDTPAINGIRCINVADPDNPALLKNLVLPDGTGLFRLAINGGKLYAGYYMNIYMFDIFAPGAESFERVFAVSGSFFSYDIDTYNDYVVLIYNGWVKQLLVVWD
jgi:hypothetical protein